MRETLFKTGVNAPFALDGTYLTLCLGEIKEGDLLLFVCARTTLPCRIGLGEQPIVGFSNPSKAQRVFELLAVTRY